MNVMNMKAVLALALVAFAITPPPAHAEIGIPELVSDCMFESYERYANAELQFELAARNGLRMGVGSLEDVCTKILIPGGNDESAKKCDYKDVLVTDFVMPWYYRVTATGRDPAIPGSYYQASYAYTEDWEPSNSYCVMVQKTCKINVLDGGDSVFAYDKRNVGPGYHQAYWANYRAIALRYDIYAGCFSAVHGGDLTGGGSFDPARLFQVSGQSEGSGGSPIYFV